MTIMIFVIYAAATISHLCKMTAAAIQGWLLFKIGIYGNVIMIAAAIVTPKYIWSGV